MKKISLIIPAFTEEFFIEDMLVNILFWTALPSEIIIVNTFGKNISIKAEIIKKLKNEKIDLVIINKKKFVPRRCKKYWYFKF